MGGSRRAAAVKTLADMRWLIAPVEAAECAFSFLGFVYELHGCDGDVLGCAGAAHAPPFDFYPIGPVDRRTHSTHALPPEGVLHVLSCLPEMPVPPAWVLCIRGAAFELGAGLSPKAEGHLTAALAFLTEQVLRAAPDTWPACRPAGAQR